jgi:hypothetical protein
MKDVLSKQPGLNGHLVINQQKEASDLLDQLVTPDNTYIETGLFFQNQGQKNSDQSLTTP